MSTGKFSGKRVRDLQRIVHVVSGLVVGAYIYTPLADVSAFSALVQVVVVPVLVAAGMAMWQLARLRRLLARRRPTTRTKHANSA
jgi:hypothetical protein